MQCRSCGTPILASFKHAISKNECPACGSQIMDEESLALIENIENLIKEEASVRDETAHHLAMTLVAKYDISLINSELPIKQNPKSVPYKIAPPSSIKQAIKRESDVVQVPEIPEGISDRERDKIFEEAVRKKYQTVDQIQSDIMTNDIDESQVDIVASDSIFSEGSSVPILEQDRVARLAKQQRAMNGGGAGAFRRSS